MATLNTISRLEARAVLLFHGKKQLVSSEIRIKDYYTTYFSIPTASRVSLFFKAAKRKSIKSASRPISKVFHWCFQKIEKASISSYDNQSFLEISDIVPYKKLEVPYLPSPAFQTERPGRVFLQLKEKPEQDFSEFCPPCLMKETPYIQNILIPKSDDLMQISQSSLESKGVIKRCPSGLFYIQVEKKPGQELSDIENSLIETLNEFSKIESYSANPIIPIILPKEAMQSENLGIKNIIGQTVRFTISKLSATRQVNDAQETAHMFLEVDSQELIDLREKFLLPSRISSHNFHILLCCMKKEATPTKSLFRLNISCHAA